MNAKHILPLSGRRLILPCLILLIGSFARLYLFGIVPAGCQMDEAYSAWNAFSLYHCGIDSAGHSYPVYFEAWGGGQNALNSYLMLPLIALFGGHVNAYVIRIPQLLLALASLTAVYFLIKKLFDQNTAYWGMFLLAVCPWHIMMSRWGLESNLAPGFLILGLCFFVYGLERAPFMLLSALCYGLSLYSYATIWPIVPLMLTLQVLYCAMHHRLKLSGWIIASAVLLILSAFPLLCFLFVNMGVLPSFRIGPFSVYKMTYFRSGELARSLSACFDNFKNMCRLFLYQNGLRPYDTIPPYGFFYDIGRFFIVTGIIELLRLFLKSIFSKKYEPSVLLLIQLTGAGITGILITVSMPQINCAYIPLMASGAVGIITFVHLFKIVLRIRSQKAAVIGAHILYFCIALSFLYSFCGFTREYFTSYRELVSAYFQDETDEAVRTAYQIADEKKGDIVIEDALKYPNVLLALEIPADDYLRTVTYSTTPPSPASFQKENVTIYMGIDFELLSARNVYLIYEKDIDRFPGWNSIPFGHWFVVYQM